MSRGRRSHFSSAEWEFLLASLDQSSKQLIALMASTAPTNETYQLAIKAHEALGALRQRLHPAAPQPGFKTPG